MAVLVTGVGYIGAKLVERLLEQGEEVVAVENFFSTDEQAVRRFQQHDAFTLITGDITDADVLREAFSARPIATVYSLAAQSSAHHSAADPRNTEMTNLLGPRLLLDGMREFGVERIVYASSFKVYGQPLPALVTEETPYGAFGDLAHLSQCYAEKLLEMYASRSGLTCLPIRLGIVYGLSPVMKRDARFMTAPNKFCLQAARGETIELHAGSDQPAGFIHVADAVDVMLEAGRAALSGYVPVNAVTEILSIAEVAGFVEAAAEQRGLDVTIRRLDSDDRPVPSHNIAVQSRLASFFERPMRTMQETPGEVIDSFRAAG